METDPIDGIEGGIGDHAKPSDFDAKELRMGAEVEFEHTNNMATAIEIAMDHLSELKDYYTRLVKMEKEGRRKKMKIVFLLLLVSFLYSSLNSYRCTRILGKLSISNY